MAGTILPGSKTTHGEWRGMVEKGTLRPMTDIVRWITKGGKPIPIRKRKGLDSAKYAEATERYTEALTTWYGIRKGLVPLDAESSKHSAIEKRREEATEFANKLMREDKDTFLHMVFGEGTFREFSVLQKRYLLSEEERTLLEGLDDMLFANSEDKWSSWPDVKTHRYVQHLFENWKTDGRSMGGHLLQLIAAKMFRKTPNLFFSLRSEIEHASEKHVSAVWKYLQGTQFFEKMQEGVRKVYKESQSIMKSKGLSKVTLYRGVKTKYNVKSVLESFSSDKKVADKYDGFGIIQREILAKDVLVHPSSLTFRKTHNVKKYKDQGDEWIVLS